MSQIPPVIVDLCMSDTEYLQSLARGRDPVKPYHDRAYELALLKYGLSAPEAQKVAPLIDKVDCSIEEKLLVNQALQQIWNRLFIDSDRKPQSIFCSDPLRLRDGDGSTDLKRSSSERLSVEATAV